MALFTPIPYNTKIDFVRQRFFSIGISIFVSVASIVGLFTHGLNYGVDFKGGYLLEIRTPEPVDLDALRTTLSALNLGDVKLQEAGSSQDIMIRMENRDTDTGQKNETIDKVKAALGDKVEYRRVETVGAKVSESLKKNGIYAVVFSLLAMLVYIWFRYEWQYGVCGIMALVHDCITVLGFYVLTGMEFNETAIIAILTTAGYSINDTVVIYDRIRENVRKFKKMGMMDLINQSVNDTLSRTVLTSSTTLIALFALYWFGGQVIELFTLPMIVGIAVGTYSSIFVSSVLLVYLTPPRGDDIVQASVEKTS
ncbi:MAG: protein translocase subunit SecF [Alphaproteobacteria bacterium]|nr:protein translocase subunit SecF [Alphaproteobacteria bacterium]